MPALSEQAREELEVEFVDRFGLSFVLEALSRIAYEKADHIATNWQDRALAKLWERAGAALDTLSDRVSGLGI